MKERSETLKPSTVPVEYKDSLLQLATRWMHWINFPPLVSAQAIHWRSWSSRCIS
jgi:hypothetical protein